MAVYSRPCPAKQKWGYKWGYKPRNLVKSVFCTPTSLCRRGFAIGESVPQRKPNDVIHHSDQGSQYTSLAFGQRCAEMGVRPSMGSVGDAYDNAMAESFFATLECELIERRSFRSKAEAKAALFSYIEGWYNPRRRHSALGYHSPVEFERRVVAEARAATEINEEDQISA